MQNSFRGGDYACSHFFCIKENIFSIGTTPENVFEIRAGMFNADVVAATCPSSISDEKLQTSLIGDSKQRKEHLGSLENRIRVFSRFLDQASITILKKCEIKRMRNVFHLHSVFEGRLKSDLDFYDILPSLMPMISARPQELRSFADPQKTPLRYYGGLVGRHHMQDSGCYLNIRNLTLKNGTLYATAGAGIMKESTALAEFEEVNSKVSGVFESVHLWDYKS